MDNAELTRRVQEIDTTVVRHSEQIKTAFAQISEFKILAESVHKLATTVEVLVQKLQVTNEKVDSMGKDVEEIKIKPARRWESVVKVVVTALVTAAVTYALTLIGM